MRRAQEHITHNAIRTTQYENMNKKGLTFLEILAALLIISIAFIPMMKLMTGGIERARGIDAVTCSAFLAEGKTEQIRGLILGSNPAYGFDQDYTQSATSFPSPNSDFKYTISDNGADDIKELSITVWLDENSNDVFDSDEGGVNLDTKVADRG